MADWLTTEWNSWRPKHRHDTDRSEPKMSTSVYQNVNDLMTENKPDLRKPPQSVPKSSHLDTQEMLNNDDEAADFISPQKLPTQSQNNDQDLQGFHWPGLMIASLAMKMGSILEQ